MLRTFVVVSALIAIAVGSAGSSARISPFGIVEGVTDCGSAGELGTLEVTDCTIVPCHYVPNTIVDNALRFRASVTSDDLTLLLYSKVEVEWTIFLEVPIDGVIEAGILYELLFQVPVLPSYANMAFDVRMFIVDLETSPHWVEVCAEIPVRIGPVP